MADFIDLSGMQHSIDNLRSYIVELDSKVSATYKEMSGVRQQMEDLRHDFEKMLSEQRRSFALEQATSELVSVRQDMEKRFGNYRNVRNTMIGILQATDAALVRKATMSTVSEELMISTPNYWLAPVLVALSAWIGNNRDLAERAIKEAMLRDKEHTALVMALICRRNKRQKAAYEWLNIFFQEQNAISFKADSMVYIDAYVNGIFGADDKHLCDGYVEKWLSQVKSADVDFENKETSNWNEFFKTFRVNEAEKFPHLASVAKEFGYIDDYLGRMDAIVRIKTHFQNIKEAVIDHDALAAEIDRHLMKLVNSNDPTERELREKEEYLLAVKACDGDIEEAKEIVRQRKEEEKMKTMNIVDHFARAISDKHNLVSNSQKKTAVALLQPYIQKGYRRFLTESKELFPKSITIEQDEWHGVLTTQNDVSSLQQSYAAHIHAKKEEELKRIAAQGARYTVVRIAMLVASILSLMIMPPLSFIFFVLTIVVYVMTIKNVKMYKNQIKTTNEAFTKKEVEGKEKISQCAEEWNTAKESYSASEVTMQKALA